MEKETISAILSFFIWGSGQFFICRQRLKGLILFLLQISLISIEFFTGYWFEYFTGLISEFSFRLHGGFFTKAMWGFITLGDRAGTKNGDHSTMLLISGIIAGLVLSIFLSVYILNLRDAWLSGKKLNLTGVYTGSLDSLRTFKSSLFAYLVLGPIILLLVFILLMPIIFTITIAFTNYNRDHLPPGNLVDWVGFANFKNLLNVPIWSTTFFSVLFWTAIWAVGASVTTYCLGLFQALILSHNSVKFKTLFRTILILPWAMPSMVTLLVFKNILNGQFGPLNRMLLDIGIIQTRIPFLTDPTIAKLTVLGVNLWLGFPIFMVMLLGVMSNMDRSIMEAAFIDGATGFQTFRFVRFPILLRATSPLVIITITTNFFNFGSIYFLTTGGPANPDYQFAGSSDILISWIYKLTLDNQMYNMASVLILLLFIVMGTVSVINFRRTKAFREG